MSEGVKNVLRTLVYEKQVSLTLADTTAIVQEGIRRHRLSKASALAFGKAISAMTFMSACLKEQTGEISLSMQGDGEMGEIGVSGNRRLHMRGYITNTQIADDENDTVLDIERRCLGENGALTIIRDDGYNRPFVGTCGFPKNGGMDAAFEEYFRISEQLPTRIATVVELNEKGECIFAGLAAAQPLPFAEKRTLEEVEKLPLENLLKDIKEKGVEICANAHFSPDDEVWESRAAQYQCNCSREYLLGVLASLGETQMRQIILEDGEIRVHCHYCNTDYVFGDADADALFKKE